jgi:hypothetical protein
MVLFVLLALAVPALAGVPPGSYAPELDPGTIGSALTLLAGGMPDS